MKRILFTILIGLSQLIICAQTNQNSIFSNRDKLYVNLTEDSDVFYSHTVEKGHTMYSLSKAYNVSTSKLFSYNNMQEGAPISLGQTLRIPLPTNNLYKGRNLNQISKGHYIPVYYKTKPKDNLFRISRVYFNQSTEDLMVRNNLVNNNLELGQDLLIGWLTINTALPTKSEIESEFGEENLDINSEGNLVDISVSLDEGHKVEETLPTGETPSEPEELEIPSDFNPTLLGTIKYSTDLRAISKNEVAFWDKSLPDNGTVFALHESALIDSYINVFNPLLKRSVRIKVIGRIPYGTYTNDVKLVISPRAAKQLGGIDRRFKVEVDYLMRK